jgi:hypothetical protein
MAVQTDYAQLKGFYNGSPITQITSLSLNTEAGNQRVELMGEGLGGWTTGSGACTIEVGFVVPIGGQEFDFQQDCANHAFVDLQVFVGRNSYAGRGKLDSVNISQATSAVSEGTFTWSGELKSMD